MSPSTHKKESSGNVVERSPIVVVLGHVDHGKSTLLDYIRKTNTTEKEAGGITQHISAYEVIHKTSEGKEKRITFLDTPGHKAFSKMRERGANLADVAILVVSGEDGVKEQTLEVLKTIRESDMPYVVAISKIDKPNVDIGRIKQNLAEHEVLVEGYGGNTPSVPVSAKTGAGVSELLDMVLLVTELEELKGDPNVPAEGFVVESHVNPQQGITATIILTNGTLKKGDYIGAENTCAPVRKIDAFLNHNAEEATFSSPVIITGFDTIPHVGAAIRSCKTKKEALQYIQNDTHRKARIPSAGSGADRRISIDEVVVDQKDFFVPLILKADTTGSLEALEHEISKLGESGSKLKIIQKGVGAIEEGDIKTAEGSRHALVLGFHVSLSKTAEKVAAQHDIAVNTFDIIYKLTEWLALEVKKRTPKVVVEEKAGSAKIIKIFSTAKGKQVAGGKVQEGEITVKSKVKIMRRGKPIAEGIILELQQQKKKVGAVEAGLEFGALIESKYEIAPGDVIEVFRMVEK